MHAFLYSKKMETDAQDDATDQAELDRLIRRSEMLEWDSEQKEYALKNWQTQKQHIDARVANHERVIQLRKSIVSMKNALTSSVNYETHDAHLSKMDEYLDDQFLGMREQGAQHKIDSINRLMQMHETKFEGVSPFDIPSYIELIDDLHITTTYMQGIRAGATNQQALLAGYAAKVEGLIDPLHTEAKNALQEALNLCVDDAEKNNVKNEYGKCFELTQTAVNNEYEVVLKLQPIDIQWHVARERLLKPSHTGVKKVVLAMSFLTPHLSIDQLLTLNNVTKISIMPLPDTVLCNKWGEFFGYEDAIRLLIQYIANASCLTHMHVGIDLSPPDLDTLLSGIKQIPTLTYLVLESMHITTNHCTHIATFLRENTTIKHLRIVAGELGHIAETIITKDGLRQTGNRDLTWYWSTQNTWHDRLITLLRYETIEQRVEREQTWWK